MSSPSPASLSGVHTGPLRAGEWVRLTDSKGRRHNICLEPGKRFFSNRELFHLVHVGAAAFFDAGRAWFEDDPFADSNELLRDVGVGLRLGSSRSSSGAMIHLDIAYPLDGDDSIDRLQWLVRTSETF